jgi:hypothetical protein
MRFQNQTDPPPYLNRRDQYRLLGMVLLLLFVVIAIDYAARPQNWEWFTELGEEAVEEEEGEFREIPLRDLDFQVMENGEPLPLDQFIAVPEDAPDQEEAADDESEPVEQIPEDLLQRVQDRQVGLLRSEQGALSTVLERVERASSEDLLLSARSDVGYRVLNTDSAAYRGQLIRIEGTLWRVAPFPIGEGDQRRELVQAWMFTPDSGNHPWMVLLAEKPANIEYGDQIDRQVIVAGYYFKQYGYPTETGVTIAPMLIARTLHVRPIRTTHAPRTENLSYYVAAVLGILAVLFGLMIWWFAASDRKFAKSRLAEIADSRLDAPPEVVASLNELQATDPIEALQERIQREDNPV